MMPLHPLSLTFAALLMGAPTAGMPAIESVPPWSWAVEDPADSIYRQARAALARNDFDRAAELFERIHERFPKSVYAGDALYWHAYALYRGDDLDEALALLDRQREKYPRAATRGDASALRTRIQGQLAREGDADAAGEIAEAAKKASGSCPDEDDDERLAALNALLQMDADRAVPILQKVLARRDECSAMLRRKAVFLVAQKKTPETENILLALTRDDPDQEVREQAVFWLSQVPTERAVDILADILQSSKSQELQEKALFALSQHRSERGARILRETAEREGANIEVREKAIFWLGQRGSAENADFLKALYRRLQSQELKEKVIFSLSQMKRNDKWMMDIALDEREDIEMRKKALFWAGQTGGASSLAQMLHLYDGMSNAEMREQLLFVYSQRREKEAVDKLMQVARAEKDRELRRKAIFWLSQSRDPRVAQFLLEIIEK